MIARLCIVVLVLLAALLWVSLRDRDVTPDPTPTVGIEVVHAREPAGTGSELEGAASPPEPESASAREAVVPSGPTAHGSRDLELEVRVVGRFRAEAERDEPLSSAEVVVIQGAENPGRTLRTDNLGVARIAGLGPEPALLRVSVAGYAEYERILPLGAAVPVRAEPVDADEEVWSQLVRLSPIEGVLDGRVLRWDGVPVEGALVCLDPRPRSSSGASVGRGRGRTSTFEVGPPPHTTTASGGGFRLPLLAGEPELRLLVCSAEERAPLIHRHELSREDRSGENLVEVRLMEAPRVEVVCLDSSGSAAEGDLILSDGITTHDLLRDSVLRRVVGIERWDRLDRAPGKLGLRVAPGGYEAEFLPRGEEARRAFFVQVSADDPQTHELELP